MRQAPLVARVRDIVGTRGRSLPPLAGPRSGGTFIGAAVLAIALVVSVFGSIITYSELNASLNRHILLDKAREVDLTLLRLQLDEETGLRGFLASGQRLFLQPYEEARQQFDAAWRVLDHLNKELKFREAQIPLRNLRQTHEQWQLQVADALINHPAASRVARQREAKLLVDRMRGDFAKIDKLLTIQLNDAVKNARTLLIRASASTAALIFLFGVAALIADVVRSRTQAALEKERSVTDTLQRAFLSGWDILPYLRVGTAYVSATGEAAVGGDLFDVYRLDEHRSMVLVADVSGKGISAAVETAFIKYSIRALAEDYSEPGVILEKFNRLFLKSMTDLSAFVVGFIGVLDDRDMALRYASAGHAPAYLRRGAEVQQLPVTGPVIGLSGDNPFASSKIFLQPADTLILATDGLTEARDVSGAMLDDEGAMHWIRSGDADPQGLADELVRRVSMYSGGKIADDLALLVIQVVPVVSERVAAPIRLKR